MPKVAKRRQINGCIRRGPKRKHASNTRSMHLSCEEVLYRQFLQKCMFVHGGAACSALLSIPTLIVLYTYLLQGVLTSTIPNSAILIQCLIQIQTYQYIKNHNLVARWLRLDHLYHDIPIEEELAPRYRIEERQHIRLDSWSNQECIDNTSFRKGQLLNIYHEFGLAELAAQSNGYIRIFNGHEYYNFHPEELFLFLMMRCKKGWSNKDMCNWCFGGSACRWSYGFPWILRYLDDRYEDIIGHKNLERYVHRFPEFFDKIQECIRKPTVRHYTDGTAERFCGLRFLPYNIFAFVDCKIYRCYRPFSGPAGDYIGAPRKARYMDAQRSLYTRYRKCCGVKVETVLLPNGISTVAGPYSARPNDVGGVSQMSGLDNFLLELQEDEEYTYSAFGDSTYGANHLQCIRSYFKALGGGAATPYEIFCNRRIKPCREAIEWSYAEVIGIFQLGQDAKNIQLGKRRPYAQQQVRVCHLLANIYNCLNGDKTTKLFNCRPPSLSEYLRLDD